MTSTPKSTIIRRGMPPSEILAIVADVTGVSVNQITGRRRSRRVCTARFLAMAAISHAFPRWARVDVAECVGKADHGTIYHGIIRYRDLHDSCAEFRRLADALGLPYAIR